MYIAQLQAKRTKVVLGVLEADTKRINKINQ